MPDLFRSRTSCPLCGGTRSKLLLSVRYDQKEFFDFVRLEPTYAKAFYDDWGTLPLAQLFFQVAKCGACDFIYQVYVLNEEGMEMLYNRWIDPDLRRQRESSSGSTDEIDGYDRVLSFLVSTLGGRGKLKGLRLLDFGAGSGRFSQRAIEWGFNVSAFELSDERKKELSERLVPTINSLRGLDELFDAIVLDQVIEHVADPLEVLKYVRGALHPSGVLYVDTPDSAALEHLLQSGVLDQSIFALLSPQQHINAFTNKTLRKALALSGFRPFASRMFLPKHGTEALSRRLVKRLARPVVFRYRSTALFARKG